MAKSYRDMTPIEQSCSFLQEQALRHINTTQSRLERVRPLVEDEMCSGSMHTGDPETDCVLAQLIVLRRHRDDQKRRAENEPRLVVEMGGSKAVALLYQLEVIINQLGDVPRVDLSHTEKRLVDALQAAKAKEVNSAHSQD